MSKRDPTFKPLSLAQHFEAPDDFLGCFGWVCGYSADVGFLDDAVERFTRRMHAQRAYEGRIAMALMLDPSNPQITPKEVPGVMHLPLKGALPSGFCTPSWRSWVFVTHRMHDNGDCA